MNWTEAQYSKYLKEKGIHNPEHKPKRRKFNNRITEIDGIKFDSKAEAKRYCELIILKDQGLITELDLQPKFTLQERIVYKGKKYGALKYIADFRYKETDTGLWVVEDVKGFRTDVYKIKMKLFLNMYGDKYDFREIKV